MPYIKESDRNELDPSSAAVPAQRAPTTPGELNFVITRLVDQWVSSMGLSYNSINAVMGALESAKQEFYRRVVVPYEHEKMRENGDVYENAPRNFCRPVWAQRDGGAL